MRQLRQHRLLLSNVGLVLVLLVGVSYMVTQVLRSNPLRGAYTVTVELDRSGGLQTGNDVTVRGWRIGQVTAVDVVDHGERLAARARIDSRYRIPVDTPVAVRMLSAVGEQYLDFSPDREAGPYLSDGAVVRFNPATVTTPTPISAVLTDSTAVFTQIDPGRFGAILTELDTALSGGPDQLRGLVDGLSLATAGLDARLPETTNLIASLRTVASTVSQAQPDLATLARNSKTVFTEFGRADDEVRRLLDSAPGQLRQLGAVLDKTADPITSLAANFVAITKAALLRQPALRALFPSLLTGGSALGVPAHDGEFYTILDIFPRPFCQYAHSSGSPTVPLDGSLPKWNYCSHPPNDQQIRGSVNAPRPPGPDNGAGMPAGADPNERTPRPVP